MYTYTHTYICIYKCIYVYACMYQVLTRAALDAGVGSSSIENVNDVTFASLDPARVV